MHQSQLRGRDQVLLSSASKSFLIVICTSLTHYVTVTVTKAEQILLSLLCSGCAVNSGPPRERQAWCIAQNSTMIKALL